MSPEILIVDDSAFSRNLMARALASESYAVRVAESGLQALQMVELDPLPALVLLDIQMPGLNGYEVCHRLKAQERTQAIPVIFMTADGDESAQNNAFEVGAADYITKPVQPRVMLARVKTHLTLHAQRRSLQGQLNNVVEQAPVPFLFADPAGRIVNANSAAARKFRYAGVHALLGLPLDALVPLGAPDAPGRRRKPAALPVVNPDVRCVRQDGSIFTAEAHVSEMESPRGRTRMVVLQDVSARNAALSSMGDSRDLLRALAAQNEIAREQERKHIAREVHDELGQVLSALRMDISMMRMEYQREHPELVERLLALRRLVDRGITNVRDIAGNLRPVALDLGLPSALEWLRDDFATRTQLVCTLDCAPLSEPLPEDRAVLVYRIVQESLHNITKYAQAHQVSIRLQAVGTQLRLTVHDDGIGFDAGTAPARASSGLVGMHERAIALHGDLQIRSTPGQGCCIEVNFPPTVLLLKGDT
jgi:PAS domain S-box-containing protein